MGKIDVQLVDIQASPSVEPGEEIFVQTEFVDDTGYTYQFSEFLVFNPGETKVINGQVFLRDYTASSTTSTTGGGSTPPVEMPTTTIRATATGKLTLYRPQRLKWYHFILRSLPPILLFIVVVFSFLLGGYIGGLFPFALLINILIGLIYGGAIASQLGGLLLFVYLYFKIDLTKKETWPTWFHPPETYALEKQIPTIWHEGRPGEHCTMTLLLTIPGGLFTPDITKSYQLYFLHR